MSLNLKQDNIILISAPSGSGKTTIIQQLLKQNNNLQFSISTTTRKKRPREIENQDYVFVTQDQFEAMIKQHYFIEYALIHGKYYYGTSKNTIEKILQQNKKCILDLDVQGAKNLIKIYPESKRIFILPPSIHILKQRLYDRGDTSTEEIQERLKTMEKELNSLSIYTHFVVNDSIESSVQKILNIINE